MVVDYQETGQITTTPAHTGFVASSGFPCPQSATSVEQWHGTQSSYAITGGLWLEIRRRQESVDPSDDDISPCTLGNNPPREMQVHELRRGVPTIVASAGRLDWRAQISVVVRTLASTSKMTVEDDDVDDDESEYEKIKVLMANSTIIPRIDNFLSTQLNKRLQLFSHS